MHSRFSVARPHVPKADTLSIDPAPGEVADSGEDKPGASLDHGTAGVLGLEILDASKRIPDPASVNPSVAV